MLSIGNRPVVWQTLANYTERGWGFIYSLILARVILPAEFGLYALALGVVALTAMLTKWEIGNIVRVDPNYQTDEGFAHVWAMTKLLAKVELAILVITCVCLFSTGAATLAWLILIIGGCNALDKFPNLLRCDLESKHSFAPNFKVKLIFTPIAALITIPMGFMGFGVWALVSSAWVGFMVNWYVYRHYNKREILIKKIDLEELRAIIKPGAWQWVCYIAHVLYTRVDKLVLGLLGSKAEVGYYNRAFNYAPLSFLFLGAAAGNAAIVQFANVEHEKALWRLFTKKAVILVASGILMGILWLTIGETIVLLLFGKNWLPALPYFQAFSMFGAVQAIYFLSTSLMQSKKLYKQQGVICLFVIAATALIGVFVVETPIHFVIALQISMVVAASMMIIKNLILKENKV